MKQPWSSRWSTTVLFAGRGVARRDGRAMKCFQGWRTHGVKCSCAALSAAYASAAEPSAVMGPHCTPATSRFCTFSSSWLEGDTGRARISKASACWPSTRQKRLQRVPEHSVATFPHWPACRHCPPATVPHWPACRHCPALADATVPHWLPPAPARCQWLPGQQAGA